MPSEAVIDEREALRKIIGDPRRVDRELTAFRREAEKCSSSQPRLIAKYPKQWVAVYGGRVRANAGTFDQLMQQVEEKGLPRERLMVRFIDKDIRTLIL